MNRELAEVRQVEARLASQPWGKGALAYLQENTKVQQESCADIQTKYVTLKDEFKDCEDIEKLKAASENFDAIINTVGSGYTTYKKTVLADFSKLKTRAA